MMLLDFYVAIYCNVIYKNELVMNLIFRFNVQVKFLVIVIWMIPTPCDSIDLIINLHTHFLSFGVCMDYLWILQVWMICLENQ